MLFAGILSTQDFMINTQACEGATPPFWLYLKDSVSEFLLLVGSPDKP